MLASKTDLFSWQRRVEFCETDAAGIVHFANFFRYMEQAEHALFRSFGDCVFRKSPDGTVLTYPRVRCECEYSSPAKYDDILDVRVSIVRLGTKSISFHHEILCREALVATGQIVTVCCVHDPNSHAFQSVEIPPHVRDALTRYQR